MNRLVRMIMGALLSAGMTAVAKRNSDSAETPEAKAAARESNKRTRQSMRIMRRFFRF